MRLACLLCGLGLILFTGAVRAESDVLIVTADIAQCGTVEDIEYACEADVRCCELKDELDPSEYEDEPEEEAQSFRIVQRQQYLLQMPRTEENTVLPDDKDLLLQ